MKIIRFARRKNAIFAGNHKYRQHYEKHVFKACGIDIEHCHSLFCCILRKSYRGEGIDGIPVPVYGYRGPGRLQRRILQGKCENVIAGKTGDAVG